MKDEPYDSAASRAKSPDGRTLVFWSLMLMATAVFAPCVLAPAWEDYKAMMLAEQLERDAIVEMQRDIDALERHLEGLRTDPMVVARTAVRDLGYRHRASRFVPAATDVAEEAADPEAGRADPVPTYHPSPAVKVLLDRLPLRRQSGIFLDRQARLRLMLLSAAVVVAAFVLFPPHRSRRDASPGSAILIEGE